MNLEITYLVDRPKLVPILAGWFAKEWGRPGSSATLADFTDRIRGESNRYQPPITFISFLKDELVGTAALTVREMETHPQYEYWLGSVYGREWYRRKASFSARIGWKTIEESKYRGKDVYIMARYGKIMANQEANGGRHQR